MIRRITTDHRVDLFALGVTAYEMFTFKLPWEKAESMQTLLSHMNTPGKDPREFRPDLDGRRVQVPPQGHRARPARPLPDRRRVPRRAQGIAAE